MAINKGVAAATSSFVMWGLLPIYWKLLDTVPAYEILCHRMIWSFVVLLVLLTVMGKFNELMKLVKVRKQFIYFLVTSTILSINWLIYIWAVNSNYILEASLGYYINPLVSVCFGVLFLKEKIRTMQWVSIMLAFCAVCYLTWLYGHVPWISLSLASTFACYGLLRKINQAPPLEGLCFETLLLLLPATGFLFYLETGGNSVFLHTTLSQNLLLMGTGLATTAPLVCFCYAAQKIPLYMVGLLQYLAPTINLFVGIYIYNESFSTERMLGFALIWLALVIFMWDGLVVQLRAKLRKKKENTANQ